MTPTTQVETVEAKQAPKPWEDHELEVLQRVEVIKWLDHAAASEWLPVDQLRTDPQVVITIGVPVRETDEVLLVAPTLSELDLPQDQWVVADSMMILKPLIVSRMSLAAISRAQGTGR